MEVHHHSHTPDPPDRYRDHRGRKKWTHYFWEFLMLFLAVFCGFLAENQREHLIEHRREKKFMATILEDLIKDTADLNKDIHFWDDKWKKVDTIKSEMNNKPAERNSALLYRLVATMGFTTRFEYHDRTVNQLKNAGNFRLVRKTNVSDLLSEYDSYVLNELKPAEAGESAIYQDYLNMQNKFFDSEFFTLINQPQQFDSAAALRPDIIAMRNRDLDLLFEYYNKLNAQIRQYRYRIILDLAAKRRATNLINVIKKEYHLK